MQVIEYKTSRPDEIAALMDEYRTERGPQPGLHAYVGRDRDRAGHYSVVVLFPSYEEAMRNSELPATQQMAERLAKLCDGERTFRNLDVVQEDRLE